MITKILNLEPIEGADRIEVASVLGWKVVVRKGEFKVGDYCVYLEIDTILPDGPEWSEFMRPRKFRVKTAKLRGQISQGLVFPLAAFEGNDISEALGCTKYSLPEWMGPRVGSSFPKNLIRTDEPRLQSVPKMLEALRGQTYYVTEKLDGQSATFVWDEVFKVCSRSRWITDPDDSSWWRIAKKHKLEDHKFEKLAVQGEICGPGIQGNKLGLDELEFFAFNLFDIESQQYLSWEELVEFCNCLSLKTVPFVLDSNIDKSIDEWLELAKGKYVGTTNHREGLVVRPRAEQQFGQKRLSFKVINNEFLLKEK
jgi:RNA ligase (TIGR02306 family)